MATRRTPPSGERPFAIAVAGHGVARVMSYLPEARVRAGALMPRPSASADEGGTRPRPLRRQILDRVTQASLDDHPSATPSSSPAASTPRDGKNRIGGPPPQPSLPAIRQAVLDLF